MAALGLSMIVGGTAFLLSGLIFLLPNQHKQSAREQPLEEAQNEIEFYLDQMRKKSEQTCTPHPKPPGPRSFADFRPSEI